MVMYSFLFGGRGPSKGGQAVVDIDILDHSLTWYL